MAPSPPPSLKRKLADREDPDPKKPRPSVPSVTLSLKKPFASAPIPMPNACPDYPNGFIYCHQCSKKRDVTDAIQCTFLEQTSPPKDKDSDKPPKERRCVAKFCKFCLKNRYDLDFDAVIAAARSRKKEQGHLDSAGYTYKCPKCADSCNCPRCRKSKGLEPMGSAGTIRKPPPEPVPKPSAAEKAKAARKSSTKNDSASTAKGKAVKKPKAKPLPVVKWSSIPVRLSLEDAEARFNIREFVLRFADLFEPTLPRANLEELEEIGGGRHQGRDEDEEMASWVSEFCVKSIIVGLLNLIAKELQGSLASAIKLAVKDIRSLGVNLNKIWPILSSLRDASLTDDYALNNLPPPTLPASASPFSFTFPDPLPPPTTNDIRTIRSTRNNDTNDGLHIAYSAQMVPVISALIEDVMLTGAVREEIETGVREVKEAVKNQKEAMKREAERWEQVRKTMETHVKAKAQILENRAKREYHKHKVTSLENSLQVLYPKFSPRLIPLGTDTEERVYWILSPGVSEREAASDFILSCLSDGKLAQHGGKKGGRRGLVRKAKVLGSVEERAEMRSWSWFVAVWGRKPMDAAGARDKVKVKERERQEKVKLKIKVKLKQVEEVNGKVKAKRERREEDMDVDVDVEMQSCGEDGDEEMGSVSDHSPSSTRPPSPSSGPDGDASDNEDSDSHHSDTSASSSRAASDTPDNESDQEEEEEDTERWWGFHDPFEVLKLSEWIAIKAGLDDDNPSGGSQQLMTSVPLPPVVPDRSARGERDGEEQDQESRASSSSATLNGTGGTSTPTVTLSLNGHHANGNGAEGVGKKSRDTSVTVTVVGDSATSSANTTTPRTATTIGSASARTPMILNNNKAQLKNLVDELRMFAVMLEWRCKEDKYEAVLKDLGAAAGGAGSASAASVNGNGSADGSTASGGVSANGGRKGKGRDKERESTAGSGSVSASSFYGTR
ncbi:hypothetical protein P691DRAFT_760343 [Macrolepiota fuliginosa MF-IS2]|uniref:Zinc-finger domain-containing protein n=1 Tax=Macrolepiota fuliginosa MF-IS2 TaxID=1400762 RepID=A0A9P5XD75_9AGAR|nr:hypothetical protein P691DRAFT_760343 [Macrolepiota fuliginosa MF-IS2]